MFGGRRLSLSPSLFKRGWPVNYGRQLNWSSGIIAICLEPERALSEIASQLNKSAI